MGQKVQDKLSATEEIPLTDELKAHIDKMDFAEQRKRPTNIINEHQNTSYYAAIGVKTKTENDISTTSLIYTNQLCGTYSDHTKRLYRKQFRPRSVFRIQQTFQQATHRFYSADTLKQFRPPGTLPQDVDI